MVAVRSLYLICACAVLLVLTGCAAGPEKPVSVRVIASDPHAELYAIDWYDTDQSASSSPRLSGQACVELAAVCLDMSGTEWLSSPSCTLQISKPVSQSPLPPYAPPKSAMWRPPYRSLTGTGRSTFAGHVQGMLVIAKTGSHVAAASLEAERILGMATGSIAVAGKAPVEATDGGRVTEEGVHLTLPPKEAAPNAVIFARGYGQVVKIDGQSPGDFGHGSIFSIAPGTHSLRIKYARYETYGRMTRCIYLPNDVEITFALPPGRVFVIEAFDANSRVSMQMRDALNKGDIVRAQFRNVQ